MSMVHVSVNSLCKRLVSQAIFEVCLPESLQNCNAYAKKKKKKKKKNAHTHFVGFSPIGNLKKRRKKKVLFC